MPTANDFDRAFAPLSDKHIAALDALLGAVESVNIRFGTASLKVDGEVYEVTPQFCAACGADASQDCPHKAITRAAVEYADELQELDKMRDYADAQSEAHLVTVGMG